MAANSIISKFSLEKTIKETNPVDPIEYDEESKKIIEKTEQLSPDLLSITEKTSTTHQLISKMILKINDICHDLITKKHYQVSLAFDIFNRILKVYIAIVDLHEFVSAVIKYDPIRNDSLLRKLLDIKHHYKFKQTIEQMTIKRKHDLFFSLLDRLNSSTKINLYLQNKFLSDLKSHQILIHSCTCILYAIMEILNSTIIQLAKSDVEKCPIGLLKSFISFIDEYFMNRKNSRANEKQNETLMNEILFFILHITNYTLTIPIFINMDFPKTCLQWLSLSYLKSNHYASIINILNNIVRHDQGLIILNMLDCTRILYEFKYNILNVHMDLITSKNTYSMISRRLDFILVQFIDLNIINIDETNSNLINKLLSFPKISLESINNQDQVFHTSEILIVLMKLCTNDSIVNYILQRNEYRDIFLNTLTMYLSTIEHKTINDSYMHVYISAIIASGNILWSISFHNKYKKYLITNVDLIMTLGFMRETDIFNNLLPYIYISKQMLSLRRAIDGIRENLFPSNITNEFNDNSNRKMICSVMICYSSANIDLCRQLYENLNTISKLSIQVNFNTGKYLWNDIVKTIEHCDVVLFLLSKDFLFDKSCRQELIYVTDTLKKLFFPIILEQDFKPIHWLHKRIARFKSIQFDKENLMNTREELLKMINEHFHTNTSFVKDSLDINKWNEDDIKEWFTNNEIQMELFEFYQFRNGHELIMYATAILPYPWMNEYERIRTRFNEKFQLKRPSLTHDQFLKFINALKYLKKCTY